MFRSSALSIPTVAIILLSAACNPSVRMPRTLSEKDTSSTVKMYVGETLEVVLKGNPSTGYRWEVGSVNKAIVRQVGKTEFKPNRKARGSGGMIIMRFKAITVGQTSLKLIFHRPFEKNTPPMKTFEVTVVVKQ